MVQTLNRACGDEGITEERLEKAFDVWYNILESELSGIKSNTESTDNITDLDTIDQEKTEILEEILELTRDNQKLLRNPDPKVNDELEYIRINIEKIISRNNNLLERRRNFRHYNSLFVEELVHVHRIRKTYVFLMLLSILRDDFPWLYDMGKELIETLNKKRTADKRKNSIREFKDIADFTFGHPMMRELFVRNPDSVFL